MEGLSHNEKVIWSCWDEKTSKEVVREAAAKGTHIKLAHKFLMNRNGWTETAAKDWFHAEVCAWIIQLLTRKQIFKVLHVMSKVQIHPMPHLMAIAKDSAEIYFRDYVVEQLEKLPTDLKEEYDEEWNNFHKHWTLLRLLEKSFEVEGTFKQNKVFGTGKARVVVNESEIKALTVDMIEERSEEWKCKVATYLFFEYFDFSLLSFSTPLVVWSHLLENNKAMILVRWINMYMSEVVRDMNARYNFFNNDSFLTKFLNVDTKGIDTAVLEKLDDLFRKWPITEEMINYISESNCFAYTKMCVYDTLCSYGIVNADERNNLYAIILRLARTQNLNLIDDIFTESCSTMTKRDFYIELAKYCVKYKLYKALAICVEGDVLDTDLSDLEKDARDCIQLWLLFKSIEQTSDKQSHVLPVYKTCEQIAHNIENYISTNPHLVLGMILLDDNKQLFDIFTKDAILKFNDFDLPNKSYNEKLPHLSSVHKRYTDIDRYLEKKDVNVYQLLSGYRGIDVMKLFEFQLKNQNQNIFVSDKCDRRSLGSLLANEPDNAVQLPQNSSEMPHFANEKLMKRYGYDAKLNHMYYLKQYRPCTASQAFVMQQYQMFNRLQEKSIKSSCCEVHGLALQNWNDKAMTACLISFISMIGCNSMRCRVHITIAKMMKDHMIKVKKIKEDVAIRTVNEYMLNLAQNKDLVTSEILQYLEEITLDIIKAKQNGTKVDISLILYESQTIVKFAMLHNLPLPEKQLREFVKVNQWFNFLLYGDVFRYPLNQMLQLSQEFQKKSYAEHLRHIIVHKNIEDISSNENSKSVNNGHRRVSKLNSTEMSPTSSGGFDFPDMLIPGRDLWEVAAICHGPEDPPGALVRAAGLYYEAFLALISTCYEPNAVGVLWAYWVLATLGDVVPKELRESLQWDISQQHPSEEEFQKVSELCIKTGFIRTLHESMLIFFPESPLTMLTAFLNRCIWQHLFDNETSSLIYTFNQHCQRKYSVDNLGTWSLQKYALQKLAISLIEISLRRCFDSALHQKNFLRCIVDVQFGKEFSVPCPDFRMIYEVLNLSMQTVMTINVSNMLDGHNKQYIAQCIDIYLENKQYAIALNIAKISNLPVNNILIAEWADKYEQMLLKDDISLEDKDWTLYVAQCSDAFRKASVSFKDAIKFLISHIEEMSDVVQKYYSLRIVMSWFDENLEYGAWREEIEHQMWNCYFGAIAQDVFLSSYQITLQFVLMGQKDQNVVRKMNMFSSEKPFSMLMSEIEIESDVNNIVNVATLEETEMIEVWRKTINKLMELKLMGEAFRLAGLFKVSTEHRCASPPCPAQIIKTCLNLAEGTCSPYELPQELRLVISSPFIRTGRSGSEVSDVSFEELVVIPEKQEGAPECDIHLAGREDADRLSALEALSARSSLSVAKQVSSYYRISLQIGWTYTSVLKYQGNSVDFINYVSGRARMPLANLVFRTFNIPTKQVADYLCLEMVAAIISPHLVKTSSFRQKEHFQYTLWGYTLNSDIEMFINMRPDSCSHIGRLMLDHLMAFRKIYKCNTTTKLPDDTLDDSCLDVETLIDEEYQNVNEEEVQSLTNTSGLTETGTVTSAETQSVFSSSTVYSYSNKTRESRRNLFDVISKDNIHIPYEVKSNIRRITKGAKLSTKQVNIISIELLVVAHECFSCACDTEGIAVVLRSAQALVARLLVARSWRLMVRLLTGLGRYKEMAYVFQALRDHHQFEFLLGQFDYMLGQQQDKINEFKQGLLDFLKMHCPGDTEAYCMVALHFNMYAEAANVKKKQSLDLIESLEKMAMDTAKATAKKPFQPPEWLLIHDNNSTKSLLETALNHCTDAAELYLQGGCLGFAGEMAGLAQQIALQISLVNASPTRLILNRSTEQIYILVSEYLSFMEGLVLMSGRGSTQWRELAYRRALTNDQAYLRDMAANRPDVAAEFLLRYKTEKKTTSVSQAAITELKNLCR